MDMVQTRETTNKAPHAQDGERRCLVTGETLPKEQLVRFVLGPDGVTVIPDLAHNLPGRGLWVKASRTTLKKAIEGRLFARAAKAPANAGPELLEQVRVLLHKRSLDHLGLACRAGIAILGENQVDEALRAKTLSYLLVASDGQVRHSFSGPLCRSFSRNELGAAFGHDQLVYVGLKGHSLTKKIGETLRQLEQFSPTFTPTEMDTVRT